MRKIVGLMILSCLLAVVMSGCSFLPFFGGGRSQSSAPAAQAAPASEPAASSAAPADEDPDSSTAEMANTLPAEFFNQFAHFGIMMGLEDFSTPEELERQMYENTRGFGGDTSCYMLWLIVQAEVLAADNGCPTKYDLGQYTDADGWQYEIPADVLHDAILSWTRVDFDVTQYNHVYGEDGEYSHGAYWPETDTVIVTIDGLGDPFPYSTDNPRIVSQDRGDSGEIIVAEVDLQDYTPLDDDSDGYVVTTITIELQYNEDNTYTLLSVKGFPGWD